MRALTNLGVFAIALFCLPYGVGQFLAQQAPYPPQYGQYPTGPQAGYGQPDTSPNYVQPQPLQPYYGQSQYPSAAQPGPPAQTGYAPAQPLSAAQLEQLVAPIALYPDTLVAQVLAASTYPGQVVQADRWRQAQGYASSDQIAAGANAQPWDASAKALTAFPQVLAQMDQNLQWTTDLGSAYYNQPQDILGAIQILRQRAQAAGNLQTTPQETVSYDQGSIELAPPNPQVVYVPTYNPWTVYGQPVSPYPGFSLLSAVGSFVGSALSSGFGSGFGGGSPIGFGAGILMSAFNSTPWGWLGWALNWLNLSVLLNHSNYYSHSTTVADWGFPYGGRRAAAERGEMARLPSDSYRAPASYGRPNAGYNGTARQSFATPATRYSDNRPTVSSPARSYVTPQGGYARPPLQAYNRIQPQFNGSQYGHSAYASGFYGGSNYGARPSGYGSSLQAYAAPAAGMPRGSFGQRSAPSYGGNASAGSYSKQANKQENGGAFHLFGGSHLSSNFYGGGKMPKPPKISGGGHFGGGHFGGGGGHFGGHGGGGGKHRL